MPMCLPSLRMLVGTPWQPDLSGSIVVIDVPDGYGPEDADADLTHLAIAGVFIDPAAVLICRTPGDLSAPTPGRSEFAEVLLDHVRCPVVTDFPGGHVDPMPTLPLGVQATVVDAGLTINQPAVRPFPGARP